jgi:DNA-binding MarR family transcriptional regulator
MSQVMDDDQRTTLFRNLFLEISIVEHLLSDRLEKIENQELTTAQFGVLNYFVRQNLETDREVTVAWAFQNSEEQMASKITSLEERGLVETVGEAPERSVSITGQGKTMLARSFAAVQREIRPLVQDIAPQDAATALEVLRELRRTLDNLPDR